jgi:hypothetical protein
VGERYRMDRPIIHLVEAPVRYALLLPLALLVAACSADFGTAPKHGTELPVELRIDSTRHVSDGPRAPTVASSPGQIIVKGLLATGSPCQDLSASAVWNADGGLELTITAVDRKVFCIGVIAEFYYTATVQDIAPGTHRLVVVHDFESPELPRRSNHMLDTSVVVP